MSAITSLIVGDDNFICRRCRDTGVWRYDENHGQPCPDCCLHNQGVWMLTFEYGEAGQWCCKAGCGTKWDGIVDYQKRPNRIQVNKSVNKPRSADKLGLNGDGQ